MATPKITNETVFNEWKKQIAYGEFSKKAAFSFDELAEQLNLPITAQRMTAMYKAGMVDRFKNFHYYGDDKFRYVIKEK